MSSNRTQVLAPSLDMAKYISNKEVVGPGYWAAIHTIAYQAVSKEEQKAAAEIIRVLFYNFPCLDPCRRDAIAMWERDPATNYVNKDRGLFEWTVDRHNEVSRKIGKPTISLAMAYEIWSGSNFCKSDCGATKSYTVRVSSPPKPRTTAKEWTLI